MQKVLLVGMLAEAIGAVAPDFRGLELVAAASGADALTLLAQGSWLGAVVAHQLPDMSGTELAVRLQADPALADLTVTLVSAQTPESLRPALQFVSNTGADAEGRWESLSLHFAALSAERMALLERVAGALANGIEVEHERTEAIRAAHNIAGSAALFGYTGATPVAQRVEELLKGTPDLVDLSDALLRLKTALSSSPAGGGQDPLSQVVAGAGLGGEQADRRPRVLLVDDDAALLVGARATACLQGIDLETAASVAEAESRLQSGSFDVAVVDLSFPGEPRGGFLLAERLRQRGIPVLMLTSSGDLEARMTAAHVGVSRFLQKPAAPAEVLEKALGLVSLPEPERPPTILAVDDDPLLLAVIDAVLAPLQVNLVTAATPQEFWNLLESCLPDLVLIDVGLPRHDGIELCRVLRSDPRWESLPVLFLTGQTGAATLASAFAAGADDFMTKPIQPVELISRVKSRLERSRMMRRLSETDPLTGACNRRKVGELFDRYRRLAARQELPLSVAVLDLDRFKLINDTYGHAAGDSVLKRLVLVLQQGLRAEDVVGRFGGEEFVVVMAGAPKAAAAARLTDLIEVMRTQPYSPTFSAGVAEYRVDGSDLETLYRAADSAMYRAKQAGRARVELAGNGEG